MSDAEVRRLYQRMAAIYREVIPPALEQLIRQMQKDHPPRGSAKVRLRAAKRAWDRLDASPSPRQAGHDLLSARSTGEIEFAHWALCWFGNSIAKRQWAGVPCDDEAELMKQALRAGMDCLAEMADQDRRYASDQ